MMTIASRTAAAIAFASLLLMSSAYAQTTTAPAAAPAATEKKAEKPRTRGLAGMLEGSRRQGAAWQGAQEIPLRLQEGSGRQGEVNGVSSERCVPLPPKRGRVQTIGTGALLHRVGAFVPRSRICHKAP